MLTAACGSRTELASVAPAPDAGVTDVEPTLVCELRPLAEPWIWDSAPLNAGAGAAAVVASRLGFVAVWTHALFDPSGDRGELIAATLDADGRLLTETRLVSGDARPYAPRLYSTPRGLLLTWLEQPPRMSARGCLRWLDDAGAPVGSPLCPEELRGGRVIVAADTDPILVAARRAEAPTVWEVSHGGLSRFVAELPDAPQALARDGPDLLWLRWMEGATPFEGTLDVVGPRSARRVSSGTPHSDGGEIRVLPEGAVRVLWRHRELVVTDVGPTGELDELLRWDSSGGAYSWHPELHSDGRLAFGRDRRHADPGSGIEIRVHGVVRGTLERGTEEPSPHGCHPPSVALGHGRVAVAWLGATPDRSWCTPHFAVLACPD